MTYFENDKGYRNSLGVLLNEGDSLYVVKWLTLLTHDISAPPKNE